MAFRASRVRRRAGGCAVVASRRVLDTSPRPCRTYAEKGRDRMRIRTYRAVVTAVVAAMALIVGAGAAQAAFPDFTGCTSGRFCVNVQNRSGNLNINGFNVPLHESLEIRGMLIPNGTEIPDFVPPAGTTGLFARPEPVPGGLLGIEWIPGTSVLAITELAGPSSAIKVEPNTGRVRMPVKVRLVNLL